MTSIRRRLLILLLGSWTTVWVAVAVITLERSGHEVAELLDAQLAQTARVLCQITRAGNLPDLESLPQILSPLDHPYESKISFQLWRGDELISAFGGAPRGPLAETLGFSDRDIGDTKWRVYGLASGQPTRGCSSPRATRSGVSSSSSSPSTPCSPSYGRCR